MELFLQLSSQVAIDSVLFPGFEKKNENPVSLIFFALVGLGIQEIFTWSD